MSRHTVLILAVLLVCTPLTAGIASGTVYNQSGVTGQGADLLSDITPLDGEDGGETTTTAHNTTENTTESTTDETTENTTDTTQNTTDSTTDTTQDTTTNTTDDTTDGTQESTDTTGTTSENTTDDTTTSTQDATEATTDNTTETVQEDTAHTAPSETEGLNTTTSTSSGDDTIEASESVEKTTTSVDDTADSFQSVVNTTADTSESVSTLTEETTAPISTQEDTLSTAGELNETVTEVTSGVEQQSVTNLTDGENTLDSASALTEGALIAPVSTNVDASVRDSPVMGAANGGLYLEQQAASVSVRQADTPAATEPTDDSAVAAGSTTDRPSDQLQRSLTAPWSSSQSIPRWGGTAAVGGAVLLGFGYAGRRITETRLLTGAGVPRWRNLSPVLTRIRVSTALMSAGFRAGEFTDPLRHLPLIGGYSRWDDTDPLDHEKRATIQEYLEEQPGTYLSSLAEETGIALPTVRYHLKILRYEDCIESEVIRGKRRFFPAHFDSTSLVAALEDEATKRVLDALRIEEPASVSQLADVLDRDPGTITHHCKQLEAEGLIERERDGRAKVASLTPEVRDALRTMSTPDESPQPAVADD